MLGHDEGDQGDYSNLLSSTRALGNYPCATLPGAPSSRLPPWPHAIAGSEIRASIGAANGRTGIVDL